MGLTGVKPIDELLEPIDERWIVELYGDSNAVLRVMHYAMVYRSRDNAVHVVFNVEFGGIDTLYFARLCRVLDCKPDSIFISRAFRLKETLNILKELLKVQRSTVLLVFPYRYLPKNPSKYTVATEITGIIGRLALSNRVLLFNSLSNFGYYMPEGGSLHHHLVKVIVKLTRKNKWILADLVKHPVKQQGTRVFAEKTLEHPIPQLQKRTLLDWTARFKATKSVYI
ncbi:MAG: hypothetical protein QXK88_01770 [Desulfurococcaceae archaeon]